jgi:hypothetical protein
MKTAKFRPTFSFPTELTARQVIRLVKADLQHDCDLYYGQFASEYAIIGTAGKHRHFWSPWLQLEVREDQETKLVFGRFTPHPNVWTGIVFINLVLACCSFFGIMIAMSQQLAGEFPWAYLSIPICAGIALTVWLVAQTGQRLAESEMQELQSRIEKCLRNPNALGLATAGPDSADSLSAAGRSGAD